MTKREFLLVEDRKFSVSFSQKEYRQFETKQH